jgi:hypothetical protein
MAAANPDQLLQCQSDRERARDEQEVVEVIGHEDRICERFADETVCCVNQATDQKKPVPKKSEGLNYSKAVITKPSSTAIANLTKIII